MKPLIILLLVGLVGCSTPIKRTLSEAQENCSHVSAMIKNVDGEESIAIRCTWEQEADIWKL